MFASQFASQFISPPPATAIPWKRRVLLNLERAMDWTGVGSAYVKVRGVGGAIVLMYHSIAPPELARWIDPGVRKTPEIFEWQMQFLARHRRPISLSQLLAELDRGETPPAGTVVVTFDDTYQDNLTVAAPILARYGIPATWYLPTGWINRGENPWIDRLYTAFGTRTQNRLLLDIGNWDLSDTVQRDAAYTTLIEALIGATYNDRERLITQVIDRLQPTETPPRLILSWEEIRTALREFPYLEMGLHGTHHIDLSHSSPGKVRSDIEGCIADYRRELKRDPVHFAFPYNRHSNAARSLLRELGLHSAMGSGGDELVCVGADRFAIARIDPPPERSLFRFYTSGAFPSLPKTLLGRAA
ncbi:MAG: polysaccharide deacetylase family protein [Geitlerinemataceae cyanobacterium]